MIRSRTFAGISFLTAAALGVSSVTVAGPLPPMLPGDIVQDRFVQRIDNRRQKQERIDWDRRYDDHRGPGRRAAPPKQNYRGRSKSALTGTDGMTIIAVPVVVQHHQNRTIAAEARAH